MALDEAVKTALGKVDLSDTLIVVTADHDHTMTINGYSAKGSKVLDLVKNADGSTQNDADGKPFTTLVFGNGPNRQDQRPTLTSDKVMADDYLQETEVKLGSETHGGGDVMLFAGGAGGSQFKGTLDNTRVFGKLRRPSACDKGARHLAGHLFRRARAMMKYLLSLWLLGSALSFPSWPTRVPDLAARIRYVDRVTGSDGITQESQWQEKWLRVGDQVWSQRLIPVPLARAYPPPMMPPRPQTLHSPDGGTLGHPQRGDALQLRYADAWHNQLVEVPQEEYGQVAFKPGGRGSATSSTLPCWGNDTAG